MKRTTTTMALVATLALIGIGSMPVQAVSADCNKDFDIPDREPTQAREIKVSESEVGGIDIGDAAAFDVKVVLESDDSRMEFGVFVDINGLCLVAEDQSLANCGDDEILSTEIANPPQDRTCVLQPADPGQTLSYFFHFVNDGNVDLEYKAWED